jgi:hypothetical protein
MTRRHLLSLLLIGPLTAALASGCERQLAKTQLLAWLGKRFPAARKASSIGEAYLTVFPDEGDAAFLDEALVQAALGRAESAAEYADAFDAGVRADFQSDEVVRLRGWWLSRLEARACARLALARKNGA